MGVDLQLQIFILAGVFGVICLMLIFFIAGICGQLSKVKRQQRKLNLEHLGQLTGYENYAFTSRSIRPDEELSRRGYTMYEPNENRDNNRPAKVHRPTNNGKYASASHVTSEANTAIASNEIAKTENSRQNELKSMSGSYPPQFAAIPPPPAFRQKTYGPEATAEQSSSNTRNQETTQ